MTSTVWTLIGVAGVIVGLVWLVRSINGIMRK